MDINKLSGAQLTKLIADFYPDDPTPTADKLDTVLTYLDPIMYLLKYHSVKGGPLTFDIPNYDMSKAVRHRPWQKEIIEAMCDREIKDVTVMKGRQQGLSECAVESLLYMMDTFSADKLKFMYLFPKMWGFNW